ncbi:MAG TPA: tRNA (adenosine(37)-N6)-dimethylallyltransferase MiaA [Sphingobacteriaceae bacterium]|nr:tRNA (adenosine(37)-N6)-dimethylallyltransferase MiaA [Sphingobacteriaceae bacterium]
MLNPKSKIQNPKSLIVVLGPTAVGKTSLAIQLAQKFDTEIVSADSRQFFREMNIGTAKPTQKELNAAKHHFINSHSITDSFNVGDFEKAGLEVLSKIFESKEVAILVGGSGLYINAICDGFDDLPEADPEIRERLNQQLADKGIESLQIQLRQLDPDYYEKAKDNPQRLIRALEVSLSTGKPFSSYHQQQKKKRPFNIIKIGLNTYRDKLYRQIDNRVDEMINAGLVDEARSLISYRDNNALNTVGYSELFDFFDGTISFEKAVELIKQNTRRFAKRQLTWFRKDSEIRWFEPTEYQKIEQYLLSEEVG